MNAPDRAPLRLTQFSHGGGCGCKIAPALLQQIIAKAGTSILPPALLVGIETADDAAVYRLNDHQAIVATTDFFMPIVDDPYDFGAIAATNAISDVYAMGGTPLFALALVGMPIDKLPVETIRRILEGGESACARARIPVAGGHTIDSVEPIYGLVAIGLVDPKNIKRNGGAKPGDRLVLGKALGVGIYSAALKKEKLSAHGYAAMLASTTQLNTPGIAFAGMPDVHALTDVTGFGLLGHLLEMCRASAVGAMIDFTRVPLLPGVGELACDRPRHRRVGTQLGRLRAGRRLRGNAGRRRAGAPHRSADVRRPPGCVRARGSRSRPRDVSRRGLRPCGRHRRDRAGSGASERALIATACGSP